MNYTPPLQIVWKEYGCKQTAQSPVMTPAKHAWHIPACAEHLVGTCVKVWSVREGVDVCEGVEYTSSCVCATYYLCRLICQLRGKSFKWD